MKSKNKGISIVVPESSTGRLLDAFTDMIRPFSEARGLKADRIRLQREEVAVEIARRAKQRLDAENGIEQPVPPKVLIPLMEAASIEDINDEFMIEKWANLLASATTETSVEPRFIGILRELNGRQAAVFEAMAKNNHEIFEKGVSLVEDAALFLDVNQMRKFISGIFLRKKFSPDTDTLYDDISSHLDIPGCAIIDIMISYQNKDWSLDPKATFMGQNNVNELDMEILVSLGLAKKVTFYYVSKFNHELDLSYYHITELGIRFFFACQANRSMTCATRA